MSLTRLLRGKGSDGGDGDDDRAPASNMGALCGQLSNLTDKLLVELSQIEMRKSA